MTVKSFAFTGAFEDWVVPAGTVSPVAVDGYGGGTGALGGRVQASLAVTPLETLRIYVGGANSGRTGGFNGGAAGGTSTLGMTASKGGAGATDIRQGGTAVANRVIVMGGAGGVAEAGSGGVGGPGGNGGGTTGQAGTTGVGGGGGGGGGGGTPSAGGAGGLGNTSGEPGTLGVGGLAHDELIGVAAGGGGGGGYYGGGGGGSSGNPPVGGGGGGGGSSFAGTGTSGVTHLQGYASASGNGALTITYTIATPITNQQAALTMRVGAL